MVSGPGSNYIPLPQFTQPTGYQRVVAKPISSQVHGTLSENPAVTSESNRLSQRHAKAENTQYIELPKFPNPPKAQVMPNDYSGVDVNDQFYNYDAMVSDYKAPEGHSKGMYDNVSVNQQNYNYDAMDANQPFDYEAMVKDASPATTPEVRSADKTERKPLGQRIASLFKKQVNHEEMAKLEESLSRMEGSKNTDKIKENADLIGSVVKKSLSGFKIKMKLLMKGSAQVDLGSLGKVTVLRSRNPVKGSLLIRFDSSVSKLGTGSFKEVELALKLNSLNEAIPVAIARSKINEGKKILQKEHDTSKLMQKLFGKETIFASKKMVNLGNGQVGFVMPLAHGDYRPAKSGISGMTRAQQTSNRAGIPTLTKEKKLENAKKILETLRKMEKAGYVHADFKSDNVFLTENGDAQIADWGAAFSEAYLQSSNPEREERIKQLNQEIYTAHINKDPNLGALEAEKAILDSSFERLSRQAKYSWACSVFESFSAGEWQEVKEEVMTIFGDDPPLKWFETGPLLMR